MKKVSLLFFLMVLGAIPMALAQNTLLTGTVRDAVTNEVLPGAAVFIEGSTLGTSTNLQGKFAFAVNLKGNQTLRITYIGYADYRLELVAGKIPADINATLKPNAGTLSEVTITETLQGQARAINQQRAADVVLNVVSADQIGRFPDPNAAEALQRVQGVNIERDQGEGRYVLIRGLAPQFTNININGEQIPSPEASVRFVALDAIPSDQLASMEVYKTLRPDIDGDAIGGSVNLITRKANSAKPTVQASLVGGYNQLLGRLNGQGNLQFGQRYLNEKLGVMLNGSYYENNLGSHNWERNTDGNLLDPSVHEFELRDYELNRTRRGLSATIDYRFNPRHEIYLRAMHNRFADREVRRRFVFIPADEEVEQLVKDRFESQTINSFNLGGIHRFARFTFDYEGSYAYAEQNTPFDHEIGFIAGDMPATIVYNGTFPELSSSPSYLESGRFAFDAFETGNTLATDRNVTGKFNVSVPYTTGSSNGILKFGGKVRFKDKDFAITQNVYEAIAGVPGSDAFTGGYFSKNFLNGQYNLAAFPDMGRFITHFNANPAQFELQLEDKLVDEALEAFEASEDVYAGYLMTTHRFKKLSVIAGLRYEYTRVAYNSKEVLYNANDELDAINPVSGSSDYGYLLPQLNLRYALSEKTILRGAATYSYARPNFEDIIPAQEANIRDRSATIGNPNLQPVSAINLDLFAEHYMENLGLLSGGVYFKQLDNFIYARRFLGVYPLNSPQPIATDLLYTRSENGDRANLLGLELGVQKQLDFLPGNFKKLAVYLNYTLTSSEASFQRTDNGPLETVRLPGQATHVGNLSLGYNGDRFTMRVAANLNGSYLTEIGQDAANDIYVNRRIQLDVTAGYRINDKLRLFAEFINLTNQPFELYSGTADQLIQREFYLWWTRAGVKFNLN